MEELLIILNKLEKNTEAILAKNTELENEINRLKGIINNNKIDKDYLIDKLNNQVNKNSTNSGIPTSKEIAKKNKKTGANTYNHRATTSRNAGGQFNHKGSTLTKEKLEEKIKQNNIEVREFIHYINGNLNDKEIIKYRTGIETKVYVEKHIFRSSPDTSEKLPKPFYSDVTYNDDLKTIIVSLGNYFSIPYNKIKELIYDLTNGVIDISEGTIDNIYEEFSNKTDDTLNNITNNIFIRYVVYNFFKLSVSSTPSSKIRPQGLLPAILFSSDQGRRMRHRKAPLPSFLYTCILNNRLHPEFYMSGCRFPGVLP